MKKFSLNARKRKILILAAGVAVLFSMLLFQNSSCSPLSIHLDTISNDFSSSRNGITSSTGLTTTTKGTTPAGGGTSGGTIPITTGGGTPTTGGGATPTPSPTSGGVGYYANFGVGVGIDFTCATVKAPGASTGSLLCWGGNENGQLGGSSAVGSVVGVPATAISSGVSSVSTGGSSAGVQTCAVVGGALKCWGDDSAGQIGNGLDANLGATNVTTPYTPAGFSSGVTAVVTANAATCAIKSGALYCWGNDSSCQVGNCMDVGITNGSGTTADLPYALPAPLNTGVTAVALSDTSTCAIASGKLYCWGSNTSGQVGNGGAPDGAYETPIQITGVPGTVAGVAGGESFMCAYNTAGALYCWGDNGAGQLGNGKGASGVTSATPQLVSLPATVTAVATGEDHVCAIAGGRLYCWGYNNDGQLGNGTQQVNVLSAPTNMSGAVQFSNNSSPLVFGTIAGAGEYTVIGISAREDDTCAVLQTLTNNVTTPYLQSLWCWGADDNNQAGDGNMGNDGVMNTPYLVTSTGF